MSFLAVNKVSKNFSGTQALSEVSFSAEKGDVIAVCGENGAGKSTLMKILAGVHQPDSGTIAINDEIIRIANPRKAFEYGIRTVYQELSLDPFLTVTENILMGNLPSKGPKWRIDWNKAYELAKDALERFGFPSIDVTKKTSEYSVAYQQMIEITKAIIKKPKILILDEPSAVLSSSELVYIFALIEKLRKEGVTVLYISHRLEEIFEIANKIHVLKDGNSVATVNTNEIYPSELVELMVGRPLKDIFPVRKHKIGSEILKVQEFCSKGSFEDISFTIASGEIVGFFGLVGSGRTEVMRCVFGADKPDSGATYINKKQIRIRNPKQAVSLGFAMVTEERKHDGLSLPSSVQDNVGLATMNQVSFFRILNRKKQAMVTGNKAREISIKPNDISVPVESLSGGNQQKVVLAKWMLLNGVKIFILDEPTRGVDIKTKVEIYSIIEHLAQAGAAIILVSSELPEIIGMSDRLIVMRQGKIVAELGRGHSETEIIQYAAGVKNQNA